MPSQETRSLAQFAVRLQLLSDEQSRDCLAELSPDATPDDFYRLVERRGLLTPLQTLKLKKGEKDGYFLGGYRLLYKIASGSFGRVYRADDPRTGTIVAVKVLRRRWAEDKHKVELFEREGKVGLTLVHPNIVQILAVNRDAPTGQYFIVMEFVEGGNLRDILKIRKKIGPLEALRMLEEMASGLAFAFSKGLGHRDLKPTNILVSAQGTAKLVDFGLAEITGEADDDTEVDRTVDYAGLERATRVRQGDPRSDIFFLGCIFYEMLSGRPPMPPTKDKRARMDARRFENIPPLTPEDVQGPPSLFRLVETMMALDPSRRYQSATQVVEAVRRVRAEVEGKPLAPQAPAGPPALFLVEENTRLQEAMREKFRELGFRVMLSADPQRAIERYKHTPYHALVIDAGTAGEEGVQAYQKILEESDRLSQDLGGILILSEDQADWASQIKPHERSEVMVRPITMKQLARKLLEFCPIPETPDKATPE